MLTGHFNMAMTSRACLARFIYSQTFAATRLSAFTFYTMTTNPALNDPEQLSKSFEPQEIEARWYSEWERRGYFSAGKHVEPTGDRASQPFVIQFPPPNVTGSTHMGHAFNQTVMDGLEIGRASCRESVCQ